VFDNWTDSKENWHSIEIGQSILKEELSVQRVCVCVCLCGKFVPFIVKEEQMDIRKVMAVELFEHSVHTTDILNIRTGEESWVFVCDAEMNDQSLDWHPSRSLHEDWLIVTKSQQEVMMIAFIDSMDVVHKLVSVGQTVSFASLLKL